MKSQDLILLERLFLPYVIGWTFSFFLFTVFRGVGTVPSGVVEVNLADGFLLSLFVGPFCGVLAAINQRYFEWLVNARYSSLNRLILLKLLSSLFLIVFITLSSYIILLIIKPGIISINTFAIQVESIVAYFYIFITDTLFSLARRASILLGEDRIWKILSGKYYEPRQEEKIFLFVDLKDSTTIAERVGHLEYSKLLQDAFSDLALIEKFGGEVYQYIGDEIVFTWDGLNASKALNAVNSFLYFQDEMINRAAYYQKHYNMIPIFKAGIHGGPVTTVEVGKNKKEIAYHGDTINTASRIQNTCNVFNETLIVSNAIAELIKTNSQFHLQRISFVMLKGKSKKTWLYAIGNGKDVQKNSREDTIKLDLAV